MIWGWDVVGLIAVAMRCVMLGLHDDLRGAAECPCRFWDFEDLKERAAKGVSEIAHVWKR